MSDYYKNYLLEKNNVAFTVHNDIDLKTKIFEQLGLAGNTKDKLYF